MPTIVPSTGMIDYEMEQERIARSRVEALSDIQLGNLVGNYTINPLKRMYHEIRMALTGKNYPSHSSYLPSRREHRIAKKILKEKIKSSQ